MKRTLAWLLLLVASSVPARAADTCMSLPQARAAHPGKYLSYRVINHKQCWDNHGPIQRPAVRHRATPQQAGTEPVPVPRSTVIWPNLASVAVTVDAALYEPTPATGWPKLLDIDEITAPVADASGNDTTKDVCCWPRLDDGPPFRERWASVPATWFFSALKLEITP